MKTVVAKIPSRESFLKGQGALEIGYPWLSYGAIIFLEGIINNNFVVLEFGSGGSTVFWAKNCKSIKSFETNREWFKKVRQRTSRLKNVELILANEKQILKMLEKEPDMHYDLVLVDSYPKEARRILLANAVLPKIKEGGCLVIDNYLKFGMENFIYPKCEIYTFDELRYSGKGTRICKIL